MLLSLPFLLLLLLWLVGGCCRNCGGVSVAVVAAVVVTVAVSLVVAVPVAAVVAVVVAAVAVPNAALSCCYSWRCWCCFCCCCCCFAAVAVTTAGVAVANSTAEMPLLLGCYWYGLG